MEWARTWGMEFNIEKCKVMHMGRTNPKFKYTMGGRTLKVTSEEKDIGVIITDNLKPSTQCAAAAKTAQTVLGQITRAFHYRDRHIFVRLYQQYVRPHLEFATPAWSPWTEGDKKMLEKVQERAIKMVSGLRANSYQERLKELGMTTLEERRHQADMCMVRNILHGRGDLEVGTWFDRQTGARNLRSTADPLNVKKRTGRMEIRNNFFSLRSAEPWNQIPPEVKALDTTGKFKAKYKQLRRSR